MKNLIKIICIALISVMLLGLCSCKKAPESGYNDKPDNNSNSAATSGTVRLTFPEGFTVTQIALKLDENNVCSFEDFIAEANNKEYLSDFGIEIADPDARSFLLEGYLFPDTYDFYIGESASSVIKRFLRNFNSKITDEMKDRAEELGYSFDEIITIASIVQEEAGKPSEDKKVSSVIHNRLVSLTIRKLQCDCCSFYLRDSVKPYVSEERYEELLQTYSTYNCIGLPEGPITNPGIDTINAALYPADTDYYFFISNDNGAYIYAHSWEEHSRNCIEAGL
ncbi:MAG: endolytic transglycosylase MltG [Clostridia bacterium]|nr:endolytic transglycosylase MltG [Clostridia bacterium]